MAVFSNGSGFVLPMGPRRIGGVASDAVAALRSVGREPPEDLVALAAAEARPVNGGGLRASVSGNSLEEQDQRSACASAATAIARGNPAAPGLAATCTRLRAGNVAAGRLIVDALAVDAMLRGNLVDAGRRIIAATPALAAQPKSTLDVRGFPMGVAVRAALSAGTADQGYPARVRATLSPIDAAGFDKAMADTKGGGVNMVNPDEGKIFGLPAPVAIGAGVGLLGVAGLLAYKFLR